MIEFDGYIYGSAKKRWVKINQVMGVKICVVSWLLIVPVIIVFGFEAKNWLIVSLCMASFFVLPLFALIPQGEKVQRTMLPKNIVVDKEFIICKTDKGGETRCVKDVVIVKDNDEYYEIVFPFGKLSCNFICQKDLIVRGTLVEFETLFADKIQKNK